MFVTRATHTAATAEADDGKYLSVYCLLNLRRNEFLINTLVKKKVEVTHFSCFLQKTKTIFWNLFMKLVEMFGLHRARICLAHEMNSFFPCTIVADTFCIPV